MAFKPISIAQPANSLRSSNALSEAVTAAGQTFSELGNKYQGFRDTDNLSNFKQEFQGLTPEEVDAKLANGTDYQDKFNLRDSVYNTAANALPEEAVTYQALQEKNQSNNVMKDINGLLQKGENNEAMELWGNFGGNVQANAANEGFIDKLTGMRTAAQTEDIKGKLGYVNLKDYQANIEASNSVNAVTALDANIAESPDLAGLVELNENNRAVLTSEGKKLPKDQQEMLQGVLKNIDNDITEAGQVNPHSQVAMRKHLKEQVEAANPQLTPSEVETQVNGLLEINTAATTNSTNELTKIEDDLKVYDRLQSTDIAAKRASLALEVSLNPSVLPDSAAAKLANETALVEYIGGVSSTDGQAAAQEKTDAMLLAGWTEGEVMLFLKKASDKGDDSSFAWRQDKEIISGRMDDIAAEFLKRKVKENDPAGLNQIKQFNEENTRSISAKQQALSLQEAASGQKRDDEEFRLQQKYITERGGDGLGRGASPFAKRQRNARFKGKPNPTEDAKFIKGSVPPKDTQVDVSGPSLEEIAKKEEAKAAATIAKATAAASKAANSNDPVVVKAAADRTTAIERQLKSEGYAPRQMSEEDVKALPRYQEINAEMEEADTAKKAAALKKTTEADAPVIAKEQNVATQIAAFVKKNPAAMFSPRYSKEVMKPLRAMVEDIGPGYIKRKVRELLTGNQSMGVIDMLTRGSAAEDMLSAEDSPFKEIAKDKGTISAIKSFLNTERKAAKKALILAAPPLLKIGNDVPTRLRSRTNIFGGANLVPENERLTKTARAELIKNRKFHRENPVPTTNDTGSNTLEAASSAVKVAQATDITIDSAAARYQSEYHGKKYANALEKEAATQKIRVNMAAIDRNDGSMKNQAEITKLAVAAADAFPGVDAKQVVRTAMAESGGKTGVVDHGNDQTIGTFGLQIATIKDLINNDNGGKIFGDKSKKILESVPIKLADILSMPRDKMTEFFIGNLQIAALFSAAVYGRKVTNQKV